MVRKGLFLHFGNLLLDFQLLSGIFKEYENQNPYRM